MQRKDVQSRNVTIYKIILNCSSPAGGVICLGNGGGGVLLISVCGNDIKRRKYLFFLPRLDETDIQLTESWGAENEPGNEGLCGPSLLGFSLYALLHTCLPN